MRAGRAAGATGDSARHERTDSGGLVDREKVEASRVSRRGAGGGEGLRECIWLKRAKLSLCIESSHEH